VVVSRAKERRLYLEKGILVSLAMDGVEVLASGFEMDEEVCLFLDKPGLV